MRAHLGISLIALAAIGYSDVAWQMSFDTKGPTPGQIEKFCKDASGSLFAHGQESNQPTVWRFNSAGNLALKRTIPGGRFHLGTHNDFYVVGDYAYRFNASTGQMLWQSAALPYITPSTVDEHGDLYTYESANVRKRSYASSAVVWSSQGGEMIAIAGPRMLGWMQGGYGTISKANGERTMLSMPYSPLAELKGLSLPGDGAVLFDSHTSNLLRYTPGQPVTVVGQLPHGVFQLSPATGGGGVFHSHYGVGYLKPDLTVGWFDADMDLHDFDGRSIFYFFPGMVQITDLLSQQLNYLGGVSVEAKCSVRHAGSLWIGGSKGTAAIDKFDESSGQRVGGWASSSQSLRPDVPLTGLVGPGGELLVTSVSEDRVWLSRISTAGQLRWSLQLPHTFTNATFVGPEAVMSLSSDKRTLSVQFNYPAPRVVEVDVTKAQVLRSFNGYGFIAGGHAYRGNMVATSKFDLTSGQELWRIPRAGTITVSQAGDVYVGTTKNRGTNGQLRWRSAWSQAYANKIIGDRVVTIYGAGIAYLDDATGATVWSTSRSIGAGAGNGSTFDVRQEGQNLYSRMPFWDEAMNQSLVTGGIQSSQYWGMWESGGTFLTTRNSTTLRRYASFGAVAGTPVVTLSGTARTYIEDGTGGAYLIGHQSNASQDIYVARWVP